MVTRALPVWMDSSLHRSIILPPPTARITSARATSSAPWSSSAFSWVASSPATKEPVTDTGEPSSAPRILDSAAAMARRPPMMTALEPWAETIPGSAVWTSAPPIVQSGR